MHTRFDRAITTYRHRFFAERMEDDDIRVPEGKLLMMIDHVGEFPLNVLIDQSFFHKSHVTRSVNGLRDKGYILKKTNPDDRRTYLISITDKGQKKAQKIKNIQAEWEAIINAVLSEEERACIMRAQKKIYDRLKTMYENEGEQT